MHGYAMHGSPLALHQALAVLAPPRRFELLVLLLAGVDRSVSQLAEAVGLSKSCTTRHLQALARAGLVKGVRDGKRVVFRIAPRDAAAEAVLASLAERAAGTPSRRAAEPPRERSAGRKRRQAPPARTRRRAGAGGEGLRIPRSLLGAIIHVDSAAELEPRVATEPAAYLEPPPARASRPEPESGSKSDEPPALPAWRRSDLEDFLL
jgi:DNA-binding transcriptional ArsR family regulator